MTSGPTGRVQTVLGPVDPATLGVTHTHEHLLCDQACYLAPPDEAGERSWVSAPFTMDRRGAALSKFPYFPDNYELLDEREAVREALRFRDAGGGTLVDVTNRGIARDPLALARISRATGLNVVMGGGYYIPLSHPPGFDGVTEDEVFEEMVADIIDGVGDTGVRTGIIGELGNLWPPSDGEAKVLRAAARAQVETGAPILIHPGFHPDSPARILEVLLGAGTSPSGIVMGHLDFIPSVETIEWLAGTGCFMEWDIFGFEDSNLAAGAPPPILVPTDAQRIERIERVLELGAGDRVLVAHDVCMKFHRAAYGGKSYDHILSSVVPRMRRRGFSEGDLHAILVDNPARALTFA